MQNEKNTWWDKYGEAVKFGGMLLACGITIGTAQNQISELKQTQLEQKAKLDATEKMAYEIKDSVTEVKGDIKQINANLNSITEMQKMIYREVKK